MNLTHHADLEPVVPGDVLVSVSLSPYGDLLALWSDPAGTEALRSRRTTPGGASFANSRTPHPVAIRVTTNGALLLEVPAFDLAFPTAHLMPGDTVLAVGRRAKSGRHNAIHYAADGTTTATASLGDAIEHVATTRAGDVWVGYFDESDLEGLVRFGPDLQPVWRLGDDIVDCYALNVTDHAVWACYYTDFPVVRVENDRVTSWRNSIGGVTALTVSGANVGLFGGYGEDHDRLVLGTVYDGEFHATGEHRVTLPDDTPLPAGATVIGRGHELHVVTEDSWYRLEL